MKAKFQMKCPQCNTVNYCPCEHCSSDSIKWVENLDEISCGDCGYTMTETEWKKIVKVEYNAMIISTSEKLMRIFSKTLKKLGG